MKLGNFLPIIIIAKLMSCFNLIFLFLQVPFLFFSFRFLSIRQNGILGGNFIRLCFFRAQKHNYTLDFKFAEKIVQSHRESSFKVINLRR